MTGKGTYFSKGGSQEVSQRPSVWPGLAGSPGAHNWWRLGGDWGQDNSRESNLLTRTHLAVLLAAQPDSLLLSWNLPWGALIQATVTLRHRGPDRPNQEQVRVPCKSEVMTAASFILGRGHFPKIISS